MVKFPEAQAFAREALALAKLVTPTHSESDRLSFLSECVEQHATDLLNSLEGGDVSSVEQQYTVLSCVFTEFRFLRSQVTDTPRMEHQCFESQRLPMELVLQSLQFIGRSFDVFPRLYRSTQHLSVSSPECLGVLGLSFDQLVKLKEQPRPRCLVDIKGVFSTFSSQLNLGAS